MGKTGCLAVVDLFWRQAGSMEHHSLIVNVKQFDSVRIITVTGFHNSIIWLAHKILQYLRKSV